MKFDLEELKKATAYINATCKDFNINVSIQDNKLYFKFFDRQDNEVIIILYENAALMAKVQKTDLL